MNRTGRWVLLEHRDDPNDPNKIHFDLLLEGVGACLSWRLSSIPQVDGPAQHATPIPMHSLLWLDRVFAKVSGNRGWAKQILKGNYVGNLPDENSKSFTLKLHSHEFSALLEIENLQCKLISL
tara:strand:- start:589 stop:957 length:369 start_codon:yes stop_codon:yes gene_type:complete